MTIDENPRGARTRALPNVLFDAVTFGVDAAVGLPTPGDFEPLVGTIFSSCCPDRVRTGPIWGGFRICASVPIGGYASATAQIELILLPRGAVAHLSPQSSIRINPLKALAAGGEGDGRPSLDEGANQIGPHPADARLLNERQLQFVQIAVDEVTKVIGEALPMGADVKSERLWVRAVEACRDRFAPDAITLVRRLQRSVLSGATARSADAYRRGALDQAGVPAVRWWRLATGPALKVYAKRADLVRAEVSCGHRQQVSALVGSRPVVGMDGAQAAELLVQFGTCAEPMLDELLRHVAEIETNHVPPADVITALLPLVQLAAGQRTGRGAPPDKATLEAARSALSALLAGGLFAAKDFPKAGALRRVLDRLTSPEGPLMRQGSRAIYALRPEFVTALR